MPITSTTNYSLSTIQRLDIDCSRLKLETAIDAEFQQLIHWIESIAHRSNVYVTLRHATASITGRKLKSIFQSLGCTVIMKTHF